MDRDHGPVWVIAEQVDGLLQPVSLQLIDQARKLAHGLETPLEAVLLGEKISPLYPPLIAADADRVYAGDHNAFRTYHPHTISIFSLSRSGLYGS